MSPSDETRPRVIGCRSAALNEGPLDSLNSRQQRSLTSMCRGRPASDSPRCLCGSGFLAELQCVVGYTHPGHTPSKACWVGIRASQPVWCRSAPLPECSAAAGPLLSVRSAAAARVVLRLTAGLPFRGLATRFLIESRSNRRLNLQRRPGHPVTNASRVTCQQATVPMEPEDVLVMYSDGGVRGDAGRRR